MIGWSWVQISSNTILDANGVKAMPGSIPAPNPGSFNNLKERKYKWQNWARQKQYLEDHLLLYFTYCIHSKIFGRKSAKSA